jgi:type IV secretory pathway protease TraF
VSVPTVMARGRAAVKIIIDRARDIPHSHSMKTSLKMVSTKLPTDLLAEMERWRDQQPLRPPKSAIYEAALRQFLREPAKLRKKIGAKAGRPRKQKSVATLKGKVRFMGRGPIDPGRDD